MLTRSRWLLGLVPFAIALVAPDAAAQKITFGGGSGGASTTQPKQQPAATTPQPTSSASSSSESTSAAKGEEEKTEEAPESDEWKDRDNAVMESNALAGGMGLLHTLYGEPGKSGQFRASFIANFMSAGFQCSATYPCVDPSTGKPTVMTDSTNQVGATVGLSVSILDYLEAYVMANANATGNDNNHPTLLQEMGDMTLGVKGGYDFGTKWFWPFVAAELHLLGGAGGVGYFGNGTGARFVLGATADLRKLPSNIPLRVSLNASYTIDNSGAIIASTESARGQPITRIERFGLGINRVDQVDLNLGAETFLLGDRIRPFLEFSLVGAANRQGYACHTNNPSADNCLANDTDVPTTMTIGARFFPWKGLMLMAAVDVGMTGVKNFIEELAPQAPYMVYLGGGWSFDTWERPPVVQTKMVEKKVETRMVLGKIKGFVHEKGKDTAVPGAVIAWDNHPELTSLYTGPDGRFTTQGLNPGKYTFDVKADGYKDGQCAAEITKAGNDVQLDCPLEALPRVGNLIGHVRDGESNAPVPNAIVKFKDASGKELSITADSNGDFRFEGVAPGEGEISVEAPDYLAYVDHTDVKVRTDNQYNALIRHKPRRSLVRVTAKEITIKQQIQFALDQAVILPESTPLLMEIADVLIKNPRIEEVEVQGHTDNTGTPEHNMDLSERRANAVRDWLIQHGVAADRLIAKGYGQTKPLVPNVTTANKARNRRVQFIILKQEKAQPAGRGHTVVPF